MKTIAEWKQRLQPRYREALEYPDSEVFSPREMMDLLVNYEGGLASGYEVVCLVQEVFGVELPSQAQWTSEEG